MRVCGQNLSELDEDQRAALRNSNIGFVFQSFQLLPTLTAYENVILPLELVGLKDGDKDRAVSLLTDVGLGDRLDHYPIQLSGGEQQRVALARAFINSPDILFADEPTGNLDAESSAIVVDYMMRLNKSNKTTLVMVTHDLELAEQCDRIIRLKAGEIISDSRGENA